VEVRLLPLEEAIDKIRNGEIIDGKTVAALMSISAQTLL